MKILHYSLGFPPYSRGGLAKYVIDLIETQTKQGHLVSMLWPGKTGGKEPKIVKRKDVNGVGSFELVNAEYLPQIYGIKDFDEFQKEVRGEEYRKFLTDLKPDIIHIHSIMGLHFRFLEIAKELGIKTVYTSHDFFAICPTTMFFFNGKSCENNYNCIGCKECCENALSIKKMKFLQSHLYRRLKETALMKKVRALQKSKAFALQDVHKAVEANNVTQDNPYVKLREGYIKFLENVDTIHFNSSYTKQVYGHHMDVSNGIVCNITHSDIKNNFHKYTKKVQNNHLEMTYMGAIAEYKGFFMLKKVLDKLYEKGKTNFTLTVYSEMEVPEKYMKTKPPYKYERLSQVMNETDIVITPHDGTYGFTVLEALSYGVPVLVSEEVGAKDLVTDGVTGIICDYNEESIYKRMEEILDYPDMIEGMKKNIKSNFHIKEIEEHSQEVMDKIYKN